MRVFVQMQWYGGKREEEERLRKVKESKQGVEGAMQVPTAA